MEKQKMINKPSAMGKEQLLLLKKGMSKKAYKEYCRKYRSSLMLGRNYGTRRMASARDYVRNRNVRIEDTKINRGIE